MTQTSGLFIEDVHSQFDGTPVLMGVTLHVPPGTTCALMGSNGSGKSTLLNACLGFLPVTAGRVLVDGVSIELDSMRAKSLLAFVPEIAALYRSMSAIDNLRFFDRLTRRARPRSAYIEMLDTLAFPRAKADDPARTYSKGMRQKVALAIGLAKGASVFLLDEPSSGLDPDTAADLARALNELGRDGKAVLFTSHDSMTVEEGADVVVRLEDGRISSTQVLAPRTARVITL